MLYLVGLLTDVKLKRRVRMVYKVSVQEGKGVVKIVVDREAVPLCTMVTRFKKYERGDFYNVIST